MRIFSFGAIETSSELKSSSYCASLSGSISSPLSLYNLFCVFFGCQVHGELPFQNCKAAMDSVQFEEYLYGDEMGSILADIVAQFAQDVRSLNSFLTIFSLITYY
jgi:hypothetical protein